MKNSYPAYPTPPNAFEGLTKREAFAMAAMQGHLSDSNESQTSPKFILKLLELPEDTKYEYLVHYPMYIAKISIAHADELLKQLET